MVVNINTLQKLTVMATSVITRFPIIVINILNRGNKVPGGTTGGEMATATTPMLVELVSIAGLSS